MNLALAAGSLGVGVLTGVVIAVAYLHTRFPLKEDIESRLNGIVRQWENDMNYVRDRLDHIVDSMRGR